MTFLSDTANVSQALGAPLVAGTLLYAVKQVRHMGAQVEEEAKARQLQATCEFLDMIADDDVRAARGWLLAADSTKLERELSDIDLDRIRLLAVTYDRVGLIARHDLLDVEMVAEWVGAEICELWQRVRAVVLRERSKPGRAGYCRYFEVLADRLNSMPSVIGDRS